MGNDVCSCAEERKKRKEKKENYEQQRETHRQREIEGEIVRERGGKGGRSERDVT